MMICSQMSNGDHNDGGGGMFSDGVDDFGDDGIMMMMTIIITDNDYNFHQTGGDGSCYTVNEEKCIFPFQYKGQQFTQCTTVFNQILLFLLVLPQIYVIILCYCNIVIPQIYAIIL